MSYCQGQVREDKIDWRVCFIEVVSVIVIIRLFSERAAISEQQQHAAGLHSKLYRRQQHAVGLPREKYSRISIPQKGT